MTTGAPEDAAMRRFAGVSGVRAVGEAATLKLPQEAEVVVPERADARDAVAELGGALDPHAEREACVLLRVPADELVEIGVDHPRAAHLDPARVLAERAAGAAALEARDVRLHRGLREREVVGAEADLALGAVELAHHVAERPLEVGHRDPLVDHEPL